MKPGIKRISPLRYSRVFRIPLKNNSAGVILKSISVVSIAFCCVFLFTLTGCQKPPTEEVKNVQEAIAAARLVNAQKYAPEQFEKAEDELASAQEEINKQKRNTF